MEQLKKKRGRPKKILPEEIQQIVNIVNEQKEKEQKECDDNETYDILLHLRWTTDYDDI